MKLSCLLFSSALLLMTASPSLKAATVSITVNSVGGLVYTDSSGSLLNFGDAVRVGYFDPSGLSTLQNSNSFAEVNALFTPLGEGLFNSGTILQSGNSTDQLFINNGLGSAGHIFGQVENIDSNYLVTGSRLYVWAFNDSDPLAATEWGIFGAASGWDFPIENGSQTLSSFEIGDTATEIIRGSYDSASSQLRLGAVPEPTSLTLLAVVCLAHRRRRPATQR